MKKAVSFNKEGILFADIFVNNKDLFVEMFAEYYRENYQKIISTIENLHNVLNKYKRKQVTKEMAAEFESCWSDFEQWVLLNTGNLQLIVAYRGQSGRDGRFSQVMDQKDVMGVRNGVYGIDSGHQLIKDSIEAIEAAEVEKFLQTHLNGFLTQLEERISDSEAKKLKSYHNQFLSEVYQHASVEDIVGRYWREPFYSSNIYFSGQGLGKAYDAFMNHLANHNRVVYDYLSSSGLQDNVSALNITEKGSVFKEEGGVTKSGNFPRLLNESMNTTGWYTGGDIIIVNPETMSVVYNIQLKTTTKNTLSVFAEKIAAITTFIDDISTVMNADGGRALGEKLFDFMLTSVSNANDFNSIPQREIDAVIEKTVGEVIKKLSK